MITDTSHSRQIIAACTVAAVFLLLTGMGTAVPEADNVFGLEFTLYQNDTVTDTHATITEDEPLKIPGNDGPYQFSAHRADGERIYRMNADIIFLSSHRTAENNEKRPVTVRLPYGEAATEIRLSHEGDVIHTFKLPEHLCSQTQDGVCTAYCEDKRVDPDCGDTSTGVVSGIPTIPLVVVLLIAVGVGGALYWKHHKQNNLPLRRGRKQNRQIQNNQPPRRRHERRSGGNRPRNQRRDPKRGQ